MLLIVRSILFSTLALLLFVWGGIEPPTRRSGEPAYRPAEPAARGVNRPEDLIAVPGTKWVLASSMRGADGEPGALFAIDSASDAAPMRVFPSSTAAVVLDEARFADRPSPPDHQRFFPHGLAVRPLSGKEAELYVVNHGGRESIEFFRVSSVGDALRLRWVGCIRLPDRAFGNGVAALPDGGLLVTNMYDQSDADFMNKFAAGRPTGGVLRWHPRDGWTQASSQPLSGANGIEVSPDGQRFFVSEWAGRRLWSFPLNGGSQGRSVDLDFLPDNLHWTDRKTLLVAGQMARPEDVFGCEGRNIPCPVGFVVAEVDPTKLESQVLLESGDAHFGGATGALLVGKDLWVGSFRGGIIGKFVPTLRGEAR